MVLEFILGESTYQKRDLYTQDYVVIDFETTGFYAKNDDIIQIGAIKYRNDEQVDIFSTLIQPTRRNISQKIEELTGITNEMVRYAPTIDERITDLVRFIGGLPLVAHNADFDMGFLINALNDCGVRSHSFEVVDTLSLARELMPTMPNHKKKK